MHAVVRDVRKYRDHPEKFDPSHLLQPIVGAIPRTRRRGERLGVIDMMRRGGVAERVIGTAYAAQDCGSREASTSLSRGSRVRMGEWKFCK